MNFKWISKNVKVITNLNSFEIENLISISMSFKFKIHEFLRNSIVIK